VRWRFQGTIYAFSVFIFDQVRKMIILKIPLFHVIFFGVGVCLAQTNTATLQGTVWDPSGAAIHDASILLQDTSQSSKREIFSDKQGRFALTNLLPRTYNLRVTKDGFQTWFSRPLPLNVGDTKDVTITLSIGQVQDRITVEASLIDVSPAIGTTVDRNFVANLPLNGRTFQALIAITPGAVSAPASFETQGQFSVNGQRTSSNYFTIDGVSANFAMTSAVRPGQTAGGALPALSVAGTTAALLPIEAMQEFKIQTSAYAAEYGRQPGAQVQITSASGTNALHGTAYNFFRNDKLDATDWFANRNRLQKPPLRQNNFGLVLGGPVVPDKMFFLATYEGLLLRQPKTTTVAVPNLATRTSVSPALRPFVDAIAIPNGAELGNGLAQYSASYADPTTLHGASIKIDRNLGAKQKLFGRYNYSDSFLRTRAPAGYAPNTVQVDENKIQTLTLGLSSDFGKVLSEFRVNVSSMIAATREEVTTFGGAVPVPENVLYPSFTNRSESAFFFQMTQGVGFVDGSISHNRQRQINVVQGFTHATSRHLIKFGYDVRRMLPSVITRDFDIFYRFANPTGLVSGVAQSAGVRGFPVVDFCYNNYSIFGQDHFRIARSVTLSYGVRWDLNPGPHGRNGYALYPIAGTYPNFSIGSANTPFYRTTKNNFAPRIGLSWQARKNPGWDLVLRTGFGIFYDLGAGLSGSLSDNLYQRANSVANVPFPLASSVLQPIPVPANPPYTIVTGTDPNLKLPYSLHWNVAIEQSLGNHQTISLGYVAAKGDRLLQTQFFFAPNPSFQQVRYIRNTAESRYDALQARFQRRMARGFQALVSYTWSHSIDNTSGDDTIFTPPVILNNRVDRGDSDFDVRHSFNFAFTWQPRLQHRVAVARHVVNGWGIDTIWRYQAALPLGVYEQRVFPGLPSTYRTRPDLIQGVRLYLESGIYPGGRAINPAAFSRMTAARQGDLGRNSLRAFPLHQMDLSLRRNFAITERLELQFRAEAYNIFNHPNFAAPIADLTNPLFGVSQSNYGAGLGSGGINAGLSPLYQSGTPRSLQLALKLRF
jgi:hypothetical protein